MHKLRSPPSCRADRTAAPSGRNNNCTIYSQTVMSEFPAGSLRRKMKPYVCTVLCDARRFSSSVRALLHRLSFCRPWTSCPIFSLFRNILPHLILYQTASPLSIGVMGKIGDNLVYELETNTSNFMTKLSDDPDHVKSYFDHPALDKYKLN